jgi:hypothetical protein
MNFGGLIALQKQQKKEEKTSNQGFTITSNNLKSKDQKSK